MSTPDIESVMRIAGRLEVSACIAGMHGRPSDIVDSDRAALRAAIDAYGRQCAEAAIEGCAAWVNARRDAFCQQFGYTDPDTNALEFGRGAHAEAKVEYVGELEEIADAIRARKEQP